MIPVYEQPEPPHEKDYFVAPKTSGSGSMEGLLLAYTWSNYRLVGSFVNGVKSAITDVLDPFEIGEGWFALDLGTFATIVGPGAPRGRRDEICRTIEALQLDRGPIVRCRERVANLYWLEEDPLPFVRLRQEHSFLAGEIQRQGRLREQDTQRFGLGS